MMIETFIYFIAVFLIIAFWNKRRYIKVIYNVNWTGNLQTRKGYTDIYIYIIDGLTIRFHGVI